MQVYLRLTKFIAPYWKRLVLAMIFMALTGASSGFTAYIVKDVLDEIFFKRDANMLVLITFGIVLLFLFRGIFDYLQAYFMGYVGNRIVMDIRNLVFNNLQNQPLSFFDKTPTGVSISRITNDVSLIQSAVSDTFTAIMKDAFTIVGLIFVIFYRDWKLALITFTVLPFATYPIVYFGKKLRRISTKAQQTMARFMSFLHETITGQRIVKAFTMEEYENTRFGQENAFLFKINMKSLKMRALSSPVMEVLGGIAVGIIIWYGGKEVIAGTSTPGNFFSFTAALIMLYEPIKKLNKENHNIQQGIAASIRVFEIVDRVPEINESPDAAELANIEGRISIQNVSFRYEEKMVLKNVNLEIAKNEVIAIVGESGVGKSTLVNLIPRFYDVTDGSIEIDGVDIRRATLKSLRGNIALVTQDVILFNDSVKNNISYGFGQDMAKIEAAAKVAYAHDFILGLPNGYETMVGEKGVRLSGGQKQRIAIARAIYKDAPILVLDEATSSLDTESEQEVQKALENLMQGRTTVVIAHRLSTVMNANRIIVLDKGTIIEEGTHQSLIEAGGRYKRLYDLQFSRTGQRKILRIDRKEK